MEQRLKETLPSRRRILIIDDETPFAEAVAEYFRDAECEAHFVSSVRDAMKEIRSFDPDVVIADIRMPDAGGLDLLELLRGTGDHRVVIIVTAYGDIHQVWRALHFEADGFLRKPVDMEQLVRLVDDAVSRKTKTGGKPTA